MADLIDREAVYEKIDFASWGNHLNKDAALRLVQIGVDNIPAVDAVSRGVYEQIKWERDIAMSQLEEHGIAFGAKKEEMSMLEVQALKGAIALIECDAKSSCEDCYFCAYDCEKGAREVMEVLKKMLEDGGFPYPGENVGEADTRALHNDNEVYPEELEEYES